MNARGPPPAFDQRFSAPPQQPFPSGEFVPILPLAPLPAEGVAPAGTVNAGHVVRYDPTSALLTLSIWYPLPAANANAFVNA